MSSLGLGLGLENAKLNVQIHTVKQLTQPQPKSFNYFVHAKTLV